MKNLSTNRPGRLVMHVVHSAEPGGTESVLCRLAGALDASNDRHVICSLRTPRPFGGELGKDVELVCLNAGDRDRFLFIKLARVIRDYKADIVHARNWGTWTDAALACRLVQHAQLVLGFHGLQKRDGYSNTQKRRARWLGFHRNPATTVSHNCADLLQRDLGFQRTNIQVISNGVDVKRFTPTTPARRKASRLRFNLNDNDYVVVCVANFFETVKGHDILVKAFAQLAAKEPRAKLLLVGYGPLETNIRDHIARVGISNRVVFTGRVEDVEAVLPAGDLFVCCSYSEGMSNATLEAMATALPCLVTDVSDHRRMFGPIDSGLIVPPGNAEGMAQGLFSLARDADRGKNLGLQCRQLVEREYSFDRTIAGYSKFYEYVRETRTVLPAMPVKPAWTFGE